MKVSKTTREALEGALEAVNAGYNGNIRFRMCDSTNQAGTAYKFRLTVHDSKKEGARRSREGRRIASACWHVYGDFFEELLDRTPGAVIRSAGCAPIYRDGAGDTINNWTDRNIGSLYMPFFFSQACECLPRRGQ